VIQTETLNLLEWPRLCQHLATFAATKLGTKAAEAITIPDRRRDTEYLLAQTREIYDLEARQNSLNFDGIRDITEALARAEKQGILTGEELLDVATTLAGARNLRRNIEDQDNPELIPVLLELVDDLRTYPDIEQAIYRCIDDRGRVTDRANPKLAGIREHQKSLRDRIYDYLQKLLSRQSNAIQEAVITQRDGRYVVPVKAPQKDAVPGIVHDSSMSGATLYIEPNSTVPWNNQMRQLLRQEQAEEEAVRRELTGQIAAVQDDIERLLSICTTLDLAAARARYSYWLGANPPRFIDPNAETITLRQLRHPLLVWQQRNESGREVVPTDLKIPSTIRVVAITGPNTGGKTVTLKTMAIAALMAKVGLFVPAREPVELPWFDQILADIGDEQSLQQSLSTFSGHIRRIGRILDAIGESGSNSLILLDEVGAGTDPSEGSALATALLQHLADKTQLTIATTHFGELKALKYQDSRFENASVEFDDLSLSPTYRLLWGIPGRSNALTIARRLGLQESVVTAAKAQVGTANADLNQVIGELEAQRRDQEAKTQEAEKLIKQAEFFYQQVTDRAAKLKERERDIKVAQEEAVQKSILDAKSEIAKVIRQLQRAGTAQDAHSATQQLDRLGEKHLPSRQTPPAKPKPGYLPKVGSKVKIPKIGQKAEVLAISDDLSELTVRFGIMKMTVMIEEVESLTGEKVQKAAPTPKPPVGNPPVETPSPSVTIRTESNTLDVRGQRVADAEIMVDRGIAAAQDVIWIIHGHGTGKLRIGIHEFLKQHHRITRFEAAPQNEGGTGVTVCHLR
jgi:DNA mismatch repair protein MutS2